MASGLAYRSGPRPGPCRCSAPRALLLSFIFGALWGVGSLTGGLALRYLGMSLGWAIPLGLCAVLGTLLPPAFAGLFHELLDSDSGQMTLASVLVGVVGIAICAKAGILIDRELLIAQKQETIHEFNLARGLRLSLLSGVMSACMAFGIAEGRPIADSALRHGTPELWQNTPLFEVVLLGRFITNCTWCLVNSVATRSSTQCELLATFRNTKKNYAAASPVPG